MKKGWFILALLFLMMGCSGNSSKTLMSGFYEAQYELSFYKSDDLTFTPWISIDASNNSFLFYYGSDPRPSDMPRGYYVIDNDVLTATTNQFDITFQFKIINDNKLKLIGTNKVLGEELFAVLSDTAQIGDVFVWMEPLPEE